MFYLGLLLPVCFFPGITGASIPTQWVVLSCLLPLSLWKKGPLTPFHWLGAIFLAWAVLACAWSADHFQNVWGLWILGIGAGLFWLGSTLDSPRDLYRGLALGLTASSVVAILQANGLWHLMNFSGVPSGLLFNSMYLGEATALCIIALASERLWWYIPGLVPALALSHSRGAWLALGLGLAATWFRRPLWLLVAALAIGVTITIHPSPSDIQRLQIWSIAWSFASWLGIGPGMFYDIVYIANGSIVLPEYAHNDYLQLIVEYGIGALPALACWVLVLAQTQATGWPIFASFSAMALWSFPSQMPLTLVFGAVAAGGVARGWYLLGLGSVDGRPYLLPRFANAGRWVDRQGAGPVPLEPRTT